MSDPLRPMPMSQAEVDDLVRRVRETEDLPSHRAGKARRLIAAARAKQAARIKRWRYQRMAKS